MDTHSDLNKQASTGASLSYEGGKYIFSTAASSTNLTSYLSCGLRFSLGALPNYTEFTALFDSYKIRKIVVRFIPFNNSSGTNANATANFQPLLHYYIDHDDHTQSDPDETGLNEYRQRNNSKVVRLFKPVGIVIKPQYLINGPSVSSSSQAVFSRRSDWVDCAHANIPYYGLKFMMEGSPNTTSTAYFAFRCEVTYYMCFKGTR